MPVDFSKSDEENIAQKERERQKKAKEARTGGMGEVGFSTNLAYDFSKDDSANRARIEAERKERGGISLTNTRVGGVLHSPRLKTKDITDSQRLLDTDEQLQAVFTGTVAGRLASQRTQLLLISNTRVIFYGRAIVGGGSDSFPYAEISSAQSQKGLLLGSIHINIWGKTERFENMQKPEVEKAIQLIRDNIKRVKEQNHQPKTVTMDPLDQLKKLKELLDLGILTEDEFNEKKQALLKRI